MKKPNIDFTSTLDKIQSINERNKAFNKLSKEGKRLEIAWDVLKLLMSDIINPSNGVYWDTNLKKIFDMSETPTDLFEHLNDNDTIGGCSVCARGGIMLSQIRLGNTIDPNGYIGVVCRGDKTILNGFKFKTMIKIEREYEDNFYNHPYKNNTKEKLMNIMCNILVNGDFNKDDKTDYLI